MEISFINMYYIVVLNSTHQVYIALKNISFDQL